MREQAVRNGILAGMILVLAAAAPTAWAAPDEAPFGDKVSAAISYYNRASPYIATSGKYEAGAMAEVKALGFKTVVELRAPSEPGVKENEAAAQAVGLAYVNIPVTTKAPSQTQVMAFARIADDPANYPILLNCHSANRAGAMWALYRAAKGVPALVAIEEGRTAGLKPSREAAVRARLGLPPLQQN